MLLAAHARADEPQANPEALSWEPEWASAPAQPAPRSGFHHLLFDLEDEGTSPWARGELVLGQTLHGFAQGMASCNLFISSCPDGDVDPAAGAVGAALGGGVSFLLSWRGVRPGQAVAVNAGSLWGAAEGVFLALWLAPFGRPGGPAMLGMAAGTSVGAVVALVLRPDASQVALVDSTALWVSTLSLIALLSATSAGWAIGLGETLALNAGLAGGVLLSTRFRLSRARLFLIDLTGAVGLVAGFGAAGAAPAAYTRKNPALFAILSSVGALSGMGAAAYFTQGLDAPDAEPSVAILPGSAGRPGLALAGAF